jgi:hypothetical protein
MQINTQYAHEFSDEKTEAQRRFLVCLLWHSCSLAEPAVGQPGIVITDSSFF